MAYVGCDFLTLDNWLRSGALPGEHRYQSDNQDALDDALTCWHQEGEPTWDVCLILTFEEGLTWDRVANCEVYTPDARFIALNDKPSLHDRFALWEQLERLLARSGYLQQHAADFITEFFATQLSLLDFEVLTYQRHGSIMSVIQQVGELNRNIRYLTGKLGLPLRDIWVDEQRGLLVSGDNRLLLDDEEVGIGDTVASWLTQQLTG